MQKKGYIFPAVLMATLAIGLFIVTLSQLQKSTKAQFKHLNEYQRAFNIACSALVEALADLQTKQWNNRSFKNSPVVYTKEIYGGQFNLKAENHSVENVFNVVIRVKYSEKYFLFYWRLKYVPDLIDFTTLTIPLYHTQFPGAKGDSSDFDGLNAKADKDLEKASENYIKVHKIAEIVNNKDSLNEVLQTLGVKLPGLPELSDNRPPIVTGLPPFENLKPRDLPDIISQTKGISKPSLKEVIEKFRLPEIYPPTKVPDIREILTIPLTRFELAVYVVRLLEIPEISDLPAIENFNDITPTEEPIQKTFNTAVSSAFENGLVQGWKNTFFGKEVMVREHMAILLRNVITYIDNFSPNAATTEQLNKFQRIRSWAGSKIPEYEKINPTSGLSVGDGLEMLLELSM